MTDSSGWAAAFYGGNTLPDILHAPWSEVRALQQRLLGRTLALCAEVHPFYSRMMSERGLAAADFDTLDRFSDFPVTRKEQFVGDPDAFRLRTANDPRFPVGVKSTWEVVHTSGSTTGVPAPFVSTGNDYHASLVLAARASEILGLRPDDLVASVWPLTPFPTGGYVRTLATCSAVGCAVFTANTGGGDGCFPVHRSVDGCIRAIAEKRATVLWGITSFVRRILLRAAELGADFSSVRMLLVSGESSTPAMLDDMRERLRVLGSTQASVVNRYGSTESNIFVQCCGDSGWHNPAPDQTLLEVVDPVTMRHLPDGKPGLLLVTHLLRTGTVLLRYALGDIVALDRTPCPHCGRTAERIVGAPRRVGDMVKIKGTLISLTAVSEAMARIGGLQEYQLVVDWRLPNDPFSGDEVTVRAVVSQTDLGSVGTRIREEFRRMFHLSPRIEMVGAVEDLWNSSREAKVRRFLDLRKHAPTHGAG